MYEHCTKLQTKRVNVTIPILDIRRAQREPMVGPHGIGHDFTRKTIALQARHLSWNFHDDRLNFTATDGKLAISFQFSSPVSV